MTEWRKVTFLEVVQLNPRVSLTKGELYPFVEMSNAPIGSRYPENDVFQTFTGGGSKFEKRDTVIARIEPCLQNGKGFLSKYDKGFCSTEFLVFRPVNEEVMSYDFLYYFMGQQTIREAMAKTMVGASGRQRVNNAFFNDLFITLPSLPVQRRIAEVLSRYDALIENYQRQIKLLEEAAQRLYKEWFVDLRFPGHQSTPIINNLPQSWQKKKLGEIAPIKTGKKDANFASDDGAYPFFTCAQAPIKAPSYSFDDNAVILAGNGDFNVKIYRGKFEAYQRTYVLVPYDSEMLYLLFFCVSENMVKLATGASGSTIKFLTKGMIESLDLYQPSTMVLKKFNKLVEQIQSKKENLLAQIRNLSEARDRLLPKLMSGEIEIVF